MTKRIIILTFSILFLVSTTGLPLTIHFCKMQKSGTVNKKCAMCMAEQNSDKTHNDLSVKRALGSCCQTVTFNNNIKDNFLSLKTELNLHSFSFILVFTSDCPASLVNKTVCYTDSSPPPEQNNNLYLLNSILLI